MISNGSGRDPNFDRWWSRISRVVSFVLGIGILGYEAIGESSDRPWLYAAALSLIGLPVARAAESVLERFSSDSTPTELPTRTPRSTKPHEVKPPPEPSDEELSA